MSEPSSEMYGSDEKVTTVRELREMIAGLPEGDPIFVDGYEGGYSMPRLERVYLKTLEPWVESRGYCGAWSESRGPGGVAVWVLARLS